MDTLSQEQLHIIECVETGNNVIVDSVAGTGKTTMTLAAAKALSTKKFCIISYNASLKEDVRTRVKNANISNIEIHTFHSLMKSYYLPTKHQDNDMKQLVENDTPPIKRLPNIDVLVLDENQDMNFLYFKFIAKVIRDSKQKIQLFILGDYMQGLYDFKGADTRFLTKAEDIWSGFPYLITNEFLHCTMKMSYRITNQMSLFVNNVMLGEERMQACKDGPKVTYIRHSKMNMPKIIYGKMRKLMEEEGAEYSDMFVLSGSVKENNYKITELENYLVEQGIPCYVPMLENEKLEERAMRGKVVFSTFHATKGRERKYVFIIGFDHSYQKYYARNKPELICPNTLYVGATRATHCLYLAEYDDSSTDQPLRFLKKTLVDMKQNETDYIEFIGEQKTNFKEVAELKKDISKQTVTNLTRFIPESALFELQNIVDTMFIDETVSMSDIDIPILKDTKAGYSEEVSDLNGLVIPAIYCDHLIHTLGSPNERKRSILLDVIASKRDIYDNSLLDKNPMLKRMVDAIPEQLTQIDEYLYVANLNLALESNLHFKVTQIERDEYDWLTPSIVSKCLRRLHDTVGSDCTKVPYMERYIIMGHDDKAHKKIDEFLNSVEPLFPLFRFTGRMDKITDTIAWELKCTSALTIEHKLQLIIYAWLIKMQVGHPFQEKVFKLFNIRTGELLCLNATIEQLNDVMILLLRAKVTNEIIRSDEEFIGACRESLGKCPV
jgi:hypothetical protein